MFGRWNAKCRKFQEMTVTHTQLAWCILRISKAHEHIAQCKGVAARGRPFSGRWTQCVCAQSMHPSLSSSWTTCCPQRSGAVRGGWRRNSLAIITTHRKTPYHMGLHPIRLLCDRIRKFNLFHFADAFFRVWAAITPCCRLISFSGGT